MTKRKKARVYTEVFKLKVLREFYSSGKSAWSIARKWQVDPHSLYQWKKRWPIGSKALSLPAETVSKISMSKPTLERTAEELLQARITSLEHALALEKMRSRAFEKMIEIAETEEGISILKKMVPNSRGATGGVPRRERRGPLRIVWQASPMVLRKSWPCVFRTPTPQVVAGVCGVLPLALATLGWREVACHPERGARGGDNPWPRLLPPLPVIGVAHLAKGQAKAHDRLQPSLQEIPESHHRP